MTCRVPQGSLLGPLLFLVYLNDLPEVIEHSTCFGYADDYKLIANNSAELESYLANLFNWCQLIGMNLPDSKYNIVSFQKKFLCQNESWKCECCAKSKGFGNQCVRHPKLKWKCKQASRQSTTSTVVTLKKSVIVNFHEIQPKRLRRLFFPIIMFGCEVWHPSKIDLRLIEKLQKDATKWICWSEPDYKEWLTETELLPLTLYVELQSLLLYCSNTDGRYNIKINNFINIKANERTRQSTNNEIPSQKNTIHKTDENLWHWVAIFFNIASKSVNLQEPIGRTARITRTYWIFFTSTTMNITYAPEEYSVL